MKKKNPELFHSTHTNSQFIFCKTDDLVLTGADDATESGLAALKQSLADAFPEILTKPDFLDRAMTYAAQAPFCCALAVKMDKNPEKIPAEDMIAAARILHDLCRNENGLWGILQGMQPACIFPEKTEEEGLALGRSLQEKISAGPGLSVTVGIARHPIVGFEKQQIFENAAKALSHAAFFGPKSAVVFDAVSLNISGDHFYRIGDMVGAVAEFEAALELDPENVNVHNSIGVCLGQMGDLDRAMAHFDAARGLSPEDPMAWYNTGLAYKLKKDNDKALEFFIRAGEMDGSLFEAAFQAGKIYFEKGLLAEGKKYYQKAIDLEPENNRNYRFLGECHARLDRIDEAVAAYKKAVLEHPNDAAALSALGELFDKKGENPEIAILFCEQSVDIAPQNGLYRHRLGVLYEKQGQTEKALSEYKAAVTLGFDAAADVERLQAAPVDKTGEPL